MILFLFLAVRRPILKPLERVSPTDVIVEWSQPPGGATVTGYVVFYYDGSVTRNVSLPSNATSANIMVLPDINTYVISVMALAEQPFHPGRSKWKNITLCKPGAWHHVFNFYN